MERIRYVLRHYWGNDQSAIARELGCAAKSHLEDRVRKSESGKRLLRLISDHAGISQQWLSYGEGPAPPKDRPIRDQRTLPVTRVLLPGPPAEHADKLSGEELPVAESMYRQTCCWYDVPQKAAIYESAGLTECSRTTCYSLTTTWPRTRNASP